MAAKRWTREQTIVAFNLYCKIHFSKAVSTNPDVIKIADLIGRSPGAVAMKLGNFGSFDPELKKRGISGLKNSSKLDKEIWDEFHSDWDNLAYESEKLRAEFSDKDLDELTSNELDNIPEGRERERLVKQRVNQNFFRQSVLSAYNSKCCITGLKTPKLLIASHIKPWSLCNDKTEKTNPCNGLCLNSLHDKAFDLGLITITPDLKIKVSKRTLERDESKIVNDWFLNISGNKIKTPEKFLPSKTFLEFHNSNIFNKY